MICSVMALAVTSAVMNAYHGRLSRREVSEQMDENYEMTLKGEETCTLTCSPAETALP
jgi:hypothetical protein